MTWDGRNKKGGEFLRAPDLKVSAGNDGSNPREGGFQDL